MRGRERRAYVCRKCDPPLRVFLIAEAAPVPRCPMHGRMERQDNIRYMKPKPNRKETA